MLAGGEAGVKPKNAPNRKNWPYAPFRPHAAHLHPSGARFRPFCGLNWPPPARFRPDFNPDFPFRLFYRPPAPSKVAKSGEDRRSR